MQAIGIPSGTLTKDETLELAKYLLKAGYAVKVCDRELKNKKKLKCVYFESINKMEE
ncbi:hypothetical protein [Lachnoclostridium sp.]|uniref:hypothetical protein n=1 Tax=Lachnoclostridium sp. TaxID=2028282 RepID=UPI00289776D5|nr:hypothetical protein [Lachnoclostridium sp.]